MRFIRCARHKGEQNLFAFQYLGKVYYRSFKPILPGHELLVWYDEKYPQYLGVPGSIFDMGPLTAEGKFREDRPYLWVHFVTAKCKVREIDILLIFSR